MKHWIKFAGINAIAGLLVGLYIDAMASGDGYWVFATVAPLAAFLTAGFFWKTMIRPGVVPSAGRVVLVGVLTGTISHYLAFVLMSIGMNLCFWMAGGCTGSLDDPPAGILTMLGASFVYCFFSLAFVGWITVPTSIAIGLLLRNRDNTP